MNYVTLSQTKQALGIDSSDISKDAYLQDVIARASAYVDSYTNRTFTTREQIVEDELHEEYHQVIWLNVPEISEITSIEVKAERDDSWTTLDLDLYDWRTYGRICLDMPYRFVRVSYKYGGEGIPKDIEGATLQLVIDAYRAVSGSEGVSSEKIGDYSVTYASTQNVAAAATSQVKTVLDMYRVMPV